jgi:phage terminase small subunit
MTAMEDKKLTPKQQLFVEYFIKELNVTKAAEMA